MVPEQDLHESASADALDWPAAAARDVGRASPAWDLSPARSQFEAGLARMGLKRGWPDVGVFWHRRLIGIELKRSGGGRSSRTRVVRTRRGGLRELVGQEEVFPRLQEAGMVIGVCHSSGEVLDAFLAACGVPLRSHAVAA